MESSQTPQTDTPQVATFIPDGLPNQTEQYDRLRQRRNWLTQRIAAKAHPTVNWDIEYDTAERDALTWALNHLDKLSEGVA